MRNFNCYMILAGFRVRGARPGLDFAEFVFELIEDFLNVPAGLVEQSDDSRGNGGRQVR